MATQITVCSIYGMVFYACFQCCISTSPIYKLYISPQFYVIFDKWFETIIVENSLEEVPEWDVIFTQNQHEIPLDPIDLERFELHEDFLTKEEILENRASKNNTFTIKNDKQQ